MSQQDAREVSSSRLVLLTEVQLTPIELFCSREGGVGSYLGSETYWLTMGQEFLNTDHNP